MVILRPSGYIKASVDRRLPQSRVLRRLDAAAGSRCSARAASSSATGQASPKKQSYFQRAVSGFRSAPGSHLTSFLLLHEATAIGLLVPFYYFFQWSGGSTALLGGPVVGAVASQKIPNFVPWVGGKRIESLIEEWVDEGTTKVAHFGVKYGTWGFQKMTSSSSAKKEAERAVHAERDIHGVQDSQHGSATSVSGNIKGHLLEAIGNVKSKSVMDAVAAYLTVKALFIPRIAVSVAMTPFFARRVVEPSWRAFSKIFKKKSTSL